MSILNGPKKHGSIIIFEMLTKDPGVEKYILYIVDIRKQ